MHIKEAEALIHQRRHSMSIFTVSESFRKILLNWNIAPLSVVVFLCWVVWSLVEYYKHTGCTIDAASQGVLFAFLTGIIGILYKMYDSLQADRKNKEEEEDGGK